MVEFKVIINEDGSIYNKAACKVHFGMLGEGEYRVRIDSFKKRSTDQNSYYWSTCVPLIMKGLRNEGWSEIRTHEHAHDVIKEEFLKISIINEKTGEVKTRTRSTTELSTKEFTQFLEDLFQWALEYLNTYIPRPGEAMPMFLETYKD